MYNTMKEETLNFISNIFIEIAEKSVDDYDGIARGNTFITKTLSHIWINNLVLLGIVLWGKGLDQE